LTAVYEFVILLSMAKQVDGKLNRLERLLPEGLLVDASWLTDHGYSTSLRHQYVASGWLEQPTRQVYQRPRGNLGWQQVVISLQTMLGKDLVVGGRSALEFQGFAHYLATEPKQVHLYGLQAPHGWLHKLGTGAEFVYHNSERLFPDSPIKHKADLTSQPWGQWGWELHLSSPERAVLELLDELPARESFHQVDKLFEGLTNLSPRKLEGLLERCKNVKVKRLFFFFADRHNHAWLNHLNKSAVDLGKGKRHLVQGGRLDPTYLITVPEEFNGVE
jgi:hypothetical protein